MFVWIIVSKNAKCQHCFHALVENKIWVKNFLKRYFWLLFCILSFLHLLLHLVNEGWPWMILEKHFLKDIFVTFASCHSYIFCCTLKDDEATLTFLHLVILTSFIAPLKDKIWVKTFFKKIFFVSCHSYIFCCTF